MRTGMTTRRLLPEIALVSVTALVVGGLLTMVGGKEAADADATAWRSAQDATCVAAQSRVTAARQTLEAHVAATRGEAPEPSAVNSLVAAAGQMSEAVRLFAAEFRGREVPVNGVDRALAEDVLTDAGTLSTYWNSLAAEYEDLGSGGSSTQRIGDWMMRVGGAADALSRALDDLDLSACSRLADAMAPVS